ncbi:MAG: hypothetical protein M1823_000100 [Watsoniomyces obsoletus]|nr:MAG: hypothetical protein M1823_000100 [Watsoniomyces obsoletus]
MARRREQDSQYDSAESSNDSSLATYGTYDSHSTAPTSERDSCRPSLKNVYYGEAYAKSDVISAKAYAVDPRASTETYASTVPSEDDEDEEDPEYAVPELPREVFGAMPLPCTPAEFAELFPSTRRLLIRHDDTTEDGNMNLRLDTEMQDLSGQKRAFTLFHLRMYDLRQRDFSLRRYCRDSGREVCHSSRKGAKSVAGQPPAPILQRSVSNAFASLRGKQGVKRSSPLALQRQDSGYHSEEDEEEASQKKGRGSKTAHAPLLTNTIRLEFSNYAHVSLKRRGTHKSKRYECEYWGRQYTWRRRITRDGRGREVSYHLVNEFGGVLAHIVPIPLTPRQSREEAAKGSWVPPCSMWIRDLTGPLRGADVAEYVHPHWLLKLIRLTNSCVNSLIVATGLIVLVDDSIKRHFHHRPPPAQPSLRTPLNHFAPKRLLEGVFHRNQSCEYTYRQPAPSRHISARG